MALRRQVVIHCALLIATLTGASTALCAVETAGHVVSVTGTVLARNIGTGVTAVRQLKSGDAITAGDVINTSSNSSIKLLMTDRSILDLGGSSSFSVDEYKLKGGADRQVGLSMDYGTVRASVNTHVNSKGKFYIKTKSATMGVRGTEFVVQTSLGTTTTDAKAAAASGAPAAASESKTELTVLHGKVAVASGGGASSSSAPVFVTGGQQLVATSVISGTDAGGRAIASSSTSEVKTLPTQSVQNIVQTAKVQDPTFSQAVTLENSQGSSTGVSAAWVAAAAPAPISSVNVHNVGPIVPGAFGPQITPVAVNRPATSTLVNLKVTFTP